MSPLSDDSIEGAARYTAKYAISRRFGGYPGKRMSIPAIPDAGAHIIAPHAPLGLRLRDTAVVARLVAIAAFYQTRPKPKSLRF